MMAIAKGIHRETAFAWTIRGDLARGDGRGSGVGVDLV